MIKERLFKCFLIPLAASCLLFSCNSGDKDEKDEKLIPVKEIKDTVTHFSYDTAIKYRVRCKGRSELPAPTGYINDFERLFTDREEAILDSMIAQHEKESSNQFAVVTIDSAMLGQCSIIDYATDIGNAWGVGQKGKNNGVVFVLSAKLRMIRISNGLGIEKKLSSEATQSIINDIIIPEFKQADYFEGVRKGLLAIMEKIK